MDQLNAKTYLKARSGVPHKMHWIRLHLCKMLLHIQLEKLFSHSFRKVHI